MLDQRTVAFERIFKKAESLFGETNDRNVMSVSESPKPNNSLENSKKLLQLEKEILKLRRETEKIIYLLEKSFANPSFIRDKLDK